MQAVFNASITAPAGVPALFNTPEASSAPAANSSKTVHRFEPTPPMATYLVGAVIGDLEKVEGVFDSMTGDEVPVRVWGRKGMASALALARDSAIAALRGARRPPLSAFVFLGLSRAHLLSVYCRVTRHLSVPAACSSSRPAPRAAPTKQTRFCVEVRLSSSGAYLATRCGKVGIR